MTYLVKHKIELTCMLAVIGACSEAAECHNRAWGAVLSVPACGRCQLHSQSACDTSWPQTG